jgi:hypothetical protein
VNATLAPPPATLDDFVLPFEAAQARDGDADLARFLPPPDHPLYLRVLGELVRIDLEYGWTRYRPRRLDDYLARFPLLSADAATLAEVAFEEYRLRLQAGEAATPEEYGRAFGVPTDTWPRPPVPSRRPAELPAARLSLADAPASQRAHPGPSRSAGGTAPLVGFPEVGSVVLGFRLVAELGRGGFGRVYLAEQPALADRLVALKVTPDPSGEPQRLARLQHTHIVPVYSVHRAGPWQAVCMPYLGPTTLAHVLRALQAQQGLPASGKGLVSTLRSRDRAATEGGAQPAADPNRTPSTGPDLGRRRRARRPRWRCSRG